MMALCKCKCRVECRLLETNREPPLHLHAAPQTSDLSFLFRLFNSKNIYLFQSRKYQNFNNLTYVLGGDSFFISGFTSDLTLDHAMRRILESDNPLGVGGFIFVK